MKDKLLANEAYNFFNDYHFNYQDSIDVAKNILRDYNVLGKNNGDVYKSSIWFIESLRLNTYLRIDFNKLSPFLTAVSSKERDYYNDLLRCWVASLIDMYSVETVGRYFWALGKFVKLTNNLKNLNPHELILEFQEYSLYAQSQICNSLNNLIDYTDRAFLDKSTEVIKLIKLFTSDFKKDYRARVIPKTKDILVFSNVFNDFFSAELKESDYFKWMPIFFWWKLTNIIPIRPSEFAQLNRDCLKNKDNKHYLILKRIKSNQNSKVNSYQSEFLIPDYLSKEMKKYLNMTSKFNEQDTFISYESVIWAFDLDEENITRRRFTNIKFRRVLNEFYDQIVFERYGVSFQNNGGYALNVDKKLLPGDTRHLAFINLKRQGYHPTEIARIGGHSTLRSQEHYFSHVNNLIDLEILSLITKADIDLSSSAIDPSFIDDHILKPVSKSYKLKLKDGYCTDPEMNCRVNDCWECEHWRISADEFHLKQKVLELKISKKQSELNIVLKSMKDLYRGIYRNLEEDVIAIDIDNHERSLLHQHSIKIDQVVKTYVDLNKLKGLVSENE